MGEAAFPSRHLDGALTAENHAGLAGLQDFTDRMGLDERSSDELFHLVETRSG